MLDENLQKIEQLLLTGDRDHITLGLSLAQSNGLDMDLHRLWMPTLETMYQYEKIKDKELTVDNVYWITNVKRLFLVSIKIGTVPKTLCFRYHLNLRELYARHVDFAEVGGQLDLSKNSKLEYLSLERAKNIASVDLSQQPNLTELQVQHSSLIHLDVTNNVLLQSLNCSNTTIQQIDLIQNKALEKLYVNHTSIRSLNLWSNTELVELDCKHTAIQRLDLTHNLELKKLHCEHTNLMELRLESNEKMTIINCEQTSVKSLDCSKHLKLERLYCGNTPLTTLKLPPKESNRLIQLTCESTLLLALDLKGYQKLLDVRCNHTPLLKIDLEENGALEQLYCESTQIENLNLRDTRKLRNLSCQDTNIKVLDIQHCYCLFQLETNENITVYVTPHTSIRHHTESIVFIIKPW